MCRKIRCDVESWKSFEFWGDLNKPKKCFVFSESSVENFGVAASFCQELGVAKFFQKKS